MSRTSQTSPGSGVLTSQNPRFFRRGPSSSSAGDGSPFLYCTELSTGCTNKRHRKPAGSLQDPAGDPGRGDLSQVAGIVELFLTAQFQQYSSIFADSWDSTQ